MFNNSMEFKTDAELRNYVPSRLSNFGQCSANATALPGITLSGNTAIAISGDGCTDTQKLMGKRCLKIVGDPGTSGTTKIALTSIDTFMVGKPVRFSVKTKSGAAGYTAGMYTVGIAVVGGSVLPETSVSVPIGEYVATGFFIPVASTSYELRFTQTAGTDTTAIIYIDDLVVSPNKESYGAAITDWQSFTPFFGTNGAPTTDITTNVTKTGRYRRVGDSVEVNINIYATGNFAGTSGGFVFKVPSGLTVDTSKIVDNTSGVAVGVFRVRNSGDAYDQNGTVIYNSGINRIYAIMDTASQIVLSDTVPFTWQSDHAIAMTFQLPIVGWSSNVVSLASDMQKSIVISRPVSATFTNLDTYMDMGVPSKDTKGEVSGTGVNWRFTAKKSGYYKVNVMSLISSSGSDTAYAYINLVTPSGSLISGSLVPRDTKYHTCVINATTYVRAGEQLAFTMHNDNSNYTVTTFNGNAFQYLSIEEIQSPFDSVGPINTRNIIGDTSGTVVPAGYLGETVKQTFNTTVPNANDKTMTSVLLKKGRWSISGVVYPNPTSNAGELTRLIIACVSLTDNVYTKTYSSANWAHIANDGSIGTGVNSWSVYTPRVLINETIIDISVDDTPVYIVSNSTWSAYTTAQNSGWIQAVRIA